MVTRRCVEPHRLPTWLPRRAGEARVGSSRRTDGLPEDRTTGVDSERPDGVARRRWPRRVRARRHLGRGRKPQLSGFPGVRPERRRLDQSQVGQQGRVPQTVSARGWKGRQRGDAPEDLDEGRAGRATRALSLCGDRVQCLARCGSISGTGDHAGRERKIRDHVLAPALRPEVDWDEHPDPARPCNVSGVPGGDGQVQGGHQEVVDRDRQFGVGQRRSVVH